MKSMTPEECDFSKVLERLDALEAKLVHKARMAAKSRINIRERVYALYKQVRELRHKLDHEPALDFSYQGLDTDTAEPHISIDGEVENCMVAGCEICDTAEHEEHDHYTNGFHAGYDAAVRDRRDQEQPTQHVDRERVEEALEHAEVLLRVLDVDAIGNNSRVHLRQLVRVLNAALGGTETERKE